MKTSAEKSTRKRGAPAGALAGAHDGGYEGRSPCSAEYVGPEPVASSPRRVAVYERPGGLTMDLPLPNGLMARPEVVHNGKRWKLRDTFALLAGETVEQAIARELASVDTRIANLSVATLVGRSS